MTSMARGPGVGKYHTKFTDVIYEPSLSKVPLMFSDPFS